MVKCDVFFMCLLVGLASLTMAKTTGLDLTNGAATTTITQGGAISYMQVCISGYDVKGLASLVLTKPSGSIIKVANVKPRVTGVDVCYRAMINANVPTGSKLGVFTSAPGMVKTATLSHYYTSGEAILFSAPPKPDYCYPTYLWANHFCPGREPKPAQDNTRITEATLAVSE